MNKILQMLKLQQKLNDSTNGINWENGITKNGKKINWKRCIYLETAELIDSYPWKHWKNINEFPNYENIKIEIVDIWHFVMSETLRIYKIKNLGSIKDIAITITNLTEFEEFQNKKHKTILDIHQQMTVVENMIQTLFCNNNINELLKSFLIMSSKLNLKLPELYSLYIGKNILNQFRQDYGYKTGNYIKEWNGKEDNIVMQNILKEYNNITPDKLYNKLEKLYPVKL